MNIDITALPYDPEILKNKLSESADLLKDKTVELKDKTSEIKEKNTIIRLLEEKLRLATHQRFGKSSEKSDAQAELLNEPEVLVDEAASEESEDIKPYTRSKPKRKPLPKNLPRETIIHDIDDDQKCCDTCGGEHHQMGEDKSEQLVYIPAVLKVVEHVRPKYSCRQCDKSGTQVSIKQAAVPATPIPKSYAAASLLAYIIISKYQYSLPIYRLENLFKQMGVELSRQTIASWVIQSAKLLEPMVRRLQAILLAQSVVYADETPLKVIHEDKAQCYMWVYCTGTDSPNALSATGENPNIALFDYQPNRAASCAINFLQGFTGFLQVDGYAAYQSTSATLIGCWAHTRRKFKEADIAKQKNKVSKAQWALNHIQKLYCIEQKIKEKTAEEKLIVRQKESLPLLLQFKDWLDKASLQVLPKSTLGKAIQYARNQWIN